MEKGRLTCDAMSYELAKKLSYLCHGCAKGGKRALLMCAVSWELMKKQRLMCDVTKYELFEERRY
jgi:hypothetical protein